jgi:hypothetical protein
MKEIIDLDVSKGSATKAEQHNILSKSITSRRTSLATEKHEKRMKPARLDFSGAKGVIHLSSNYRISDGDQAPMRNKGELPACSESAELTSKSAELITACLESARPTTQLVRPTASTACLESVRPTFQSTKLTVSASARVSLADFQSAKLTFSVLAAVDASSDDSAPIVDCSLEMKSNIIQIKDLHFSNMINKVENTNILLKF